MMARFPYLIIIVIDLVICQASFGQTKEWTLRECIDQATKRNILVQQEVLNSEVSEINLYQSRAARIPTLFGAASQNFQFGRSVDPSTNQFVQQNYRTNNFSLNSSIVLFNGFQNNNTIEQNKLLYKASIYDVQTVQNDIALGVASAYAQVLFSKEQLENARKQVEISEAQLLRTEKLVQAGTLPELNFLQMKSQLSADRMAMINAENNLTMARVTLMQLMEMPVSKDFEVATPDLSAPSELKEIEEDSEIIYQSALQTLPQIQSASIRKSGAIIGLRVARGARLPRLTLNASVFTFYSSINSLYSVSYLPQIIGFVDGSNAPVVTKMPIRESRDYPFFNQLNDKVGEQVSLNLTVPILNNRLIRSNIERAKVNYKLSELNEQNGKNQIRKNVEQAYADYLAAIKRYDAAQEALTAAEASFLNAEKRFNVGLLNTTEFFVQKNNLVTTQSNLTQAKYDFYFRKTVLDFYKGANIKLEN